MIPDFFELHKECRQGWSFSPYLLDLAIEPQAVALKDREVMGITRRGITHRVSLYADDLMLCTFNPIEQIPKVLKILDMFGHISAYKVSHAEIVFKM